MGEFVESVKSLKGWSAYQDIREGRITDKSFVVQLWYIHRGCPAGGDCVDERYKNPILFFDRTYFTEGLSSVMKDVLFRFSRGSIGNPVILLYTPFGGGKSHTLLSLYHVSLNLEKALQSKRFREFLEKIGIKQEDLSFKTAVSLFDGEALDPKRLRDVYNYSNSWTFILGELAKSAGLNNLLNRINSYSNFPPGSEEISEIIAMIERAGIRPLILIDELAMYYKKLKLSNVKEYEREAEGLVMFLHNLSVAVANSNYAILAIATPQQYEEESMLIIKALEGIKRMAMPSSIVSRKDAASILKTALLESVNGLVAENMSRKYVEYYKENKRYVPGEVLLPEYESKLLSSYPFHPFLVDVLYGELISVPGMQGTRDILRIVAWALHWRIRSGDQADFLLLGDIDVTKEQILDELLTRNEDLKKLRDAVSYDISILQDIDHELEQKGIARIGSLTYSAILVRSAAGRPSKIEEVFLGTITPARNITPQIVENILKSRLLENTAHLHEIRKNGEFLYIIKTRANINMLINKYAKDYIEHKNDELRAELKKKLAEILGLPSGVRIVIWPRHAGDIPDDDKIKLVFLDPGTNPDTDNRFYNNLQKLIEYSQAGIGAAYRKYKNTLIFLAVNYSTYSNLIENIAKKLAIETLLSEEIARTYGFDDNDKSDLKQKLTKIRTEIQKDIYSLYTRIYYPIDTRIDGSVKLDSSTLSLSDIKKDKHWEAIKKKLREQGKISPDIAEDYLIEIISNHYDNYKEPIRVKELIEIFLKDPSKIIILNPKQVTINKIKSMLEKGRLLALKDNQYHCMKSLEKIEMVKVYPCTSKEAEEHCFIDKTSIELICKPKPPTSCINPSWDDVRKTWICASTEEIMETTTVQKPTTTIVQEYIPEQSERPNLLELKDINIELLLEKIKPFQEKQLKELFIQIIQQEKIDTNKISALKTFIQSLDDFTKAATLIQGNIHAIIRVESEKSNIRIDLKAETFNNFNTLINFASSIGKFTEIDVKIYIHAKGNVTIGELVNVLNRKILLNYKNFIIKQAKIIYNKT